MFGGSLAVTTEDLKNGIIACSPAIIFIVVVLIAVLIVVAAAGKLKQPKRALVRAQAPIAILLGCHAFRQLGYSRRGILGGQQCFC